MADRDRVIAKRHVHTFALVRRSFVLPARSINAQSIDHPGRETVRKIAETRHARGRESVEEQNFTQYNIQLCRKIDVVTYTFPNRIFAYQRTNQQRVFAKTRFDKPTINSRI